ncbi:Methyltransferase domain-containing protein [Neorhodopirellula lusitana]|uniref:Methyltransferase domain-containing protein n=2 Tax=Neorhodopirellula lusitana TaxID=445327 RepID=A0ABY1QC19_9BACT|nr:Methyltransferase domain-containing protein [Neorhodopirellula lusitana]
MEPNEVPMSLSYEHAVLSEINETMRDDLSRLTAEDDSRRLQGEYTSSQVAVLRDIASLQTKAKRTFAPNENSDRAWWVTRAGLQQSTQSAVAELKASWFGDAPVADICCGLGSDLIALANRGPVTGIDINPDVLSFAAANARTALTADKLAGVKLVQADVTDSEVRSLIGDAELLHIDPDRRAGGTRHTLADDLVPNWQRVTELIAGCDGAVIKLAPATQFEGDRASSGNHESSTPTASSDFHRLWIATGGSVREQTLVCGKIMASDWMQQHQITAGGRSAVCIRDNRTHVYTYHGNLNERAPTSGPGGYLIDPDASIRAAGLTEAFANEIGASVVHQPSGFLTADDLDKLTPFAELASSAKVLETVGCDERKLKRAFRSLGAFPDVIKVRGADIDPSRLAKRLRPCGELPLGLWIGKEGKRTYAAITEVPTKG